MGAHEYVLTGSWMQPPSWAMQTVRYRVTRRNAATWSGERVTFDVGLAEGSHSWKIVALFKPNDAGDFANPTVFSFEVR